MLLRNEHREIENLVKKIDRNHRQIESHRQRAKQKFHEILVSPVSLLLSFTSGVLVDRYSAAGTKEAIKQSDSDDKNHQTTGNTRAAEHPKKDTAEYENAEVALNHSDGVGSTLSAQLSTMATTAIAAIIKSQVDKLISEASTSKYCEPERSAESEMQSTADQSNQSPVDS